MLSAGNSFGPRFRMAFISWWLIWFAIGYYLLSSYGFFFVECITDSLLCNLFLAGACLLIANNMKYYLPRQERYWYVLLLSLGLSGIWLFLIQLLLKLLFSGQVSYLAFLSQSLSIRYLIAFLMIACIAVVSLLWRTLYEQQESSQRREAAEKMTKDAELMQLRSQLQPHFLFNSLNSISALAGTRPEQARYMIQQLSDFLRGTLTSVEKQWSTLEEELKTLALYLDIEKVRFGDRLQTELVIAPEAGTLQLPSLLLQPVVENAIKFGLYDTTEAVLIRIQARKENEYLHIEVSNPFDAETAPVARGTGFGLSSIQRRLYLIFARNDLMQTTGQDGIFMTTIRIPQIV